MYIHIATDVFEHVRTGLNIGIICALVGGVGALLAMVWYLNTRPTRLWVRLIKWRNESCLPATRRLSLLPKVKMTVTFLQLAIAFPVVFDVSMPDEVSARAFYMHSLPPRACMHFQAPCR